MGPTHNSEQENPLGEIVKVWIAYVDLGPSEMAEVLGLYSTEEKAWAALGRHGSQFGTNTVREIEVDAMPTEDLLR